MKFKALLLVVLMGSFGAPIQAAGDQIEGSDPEPQNQQAYYLSGSPKKFIHGALLGGLGYNAYRYLIDGDRPTLISNMVYNTTGLVLSSLPLPEGIHFGFYLLATPTLNFLMGLIKKSSLYEIPLAGSLVFFKLYKKSPKRIAQDEACLKNIISSHSQYLAFHYALLITYVLKIMKNDQTIWIKNPYKHVKASWKGCISKSDKLGFIAGTMFGALFVKRGLPLTKKYLADPLGQLVIDSFGVPSITIFPWNQGVK